MGHLFSPSTAPILSQDVIQKVISEKDDSKELRHGPMAPGIPVHFANQLAGLTPKSRFGTLGSWLGVV